MNETPPDTLEPGKPDSEGEDVADDRGPMVPRPAVTLMALMITTGMLINIWLDSLSTEYKGGQNTITLALLVSGILGFDLYGRRHRGGDK